MSNANVRVTLCFARHVAKKIASTPQRAVPIIGKCYGHDKPRGVRQIMPSGARSCSERSRPGATADYAEERAEVLACRAKRRIASREKRRARAAAHYAERKAAAAAYWAAHPEKRRAYASKRRASELQATPPWADHAASNAVIAETVFYEQIIGIPYHTDHVVALRGVNFSGLHVHYNLRPMVGSENLSKSNRLTGDDLKYAWPNDPVVNRECQRLRLELAAGGWIDQPLISEGVPSCKVKSAT